MVGINMEMPSCCYECEYRPKNCSYCLRLHQAIPRDIFNTSRLPNCPLVEIEERKVGKWIYKKLGVRTFGIACSNCNKVYYEEQNIGSLEEFKKRYRTNNA